MNIEQIRKKIESAISTAPAQVSYSMSSYSMPYIMVGSGNPCTMGGWIINCYCCPVVQPMGLTCCCYCGTFLLRRASSFFMADADIKSA